MTAPAVVLRGVTTILDDVPVLLRLGLEVPAGGITVLMGPSGAGKTTLVRHLAGLLQPDAGRVEIGGHDVFAAPPDELRRIRLDMSVLLGGSSLFETSLFASETGFANVRHGLAGRDIDPARRDHLVALRLRELGLERWADVLPERMPAHARRRVAIARALVAEAPLLVLDEIETGLDAASTPHVVAAVRDLHERTGCTVLLTTHDVGLARELGDELLVLCNGRIVARGPAADLLRGVDTGEEFDRRFRIADFLGPPRLEDARHAVSQRAVEERSDRHTFEIDERLLWFAAAALVLVVAFLALYVARH